MVTYPSIYPMYDPSSLFAGADDIIHRDIWFAPGYSFIPRGTILGLISSTSAGTAGSMTQTVGSGGPTCGTVTPATGAELGTYQVVFVTAGATAEFQVYDPEGNLISVGHVGTAFSDEIGFTFTDGGSHAAIGDTWTAAITGAAVSDWYAPWTLMHWTGSAMAATTDGSQVPAAIAAWDIDVTNDVAGATPGLYGLGSPVQGPAYFSGSFAGEKVIIDPVQVALASASYPVTANWQDAEQLFRINNVQIYLKTLGTLG